MAYERISGSLGRLGSFEGLGQTGTAPVAVGATSGAVAGVAQILGVVATIGAQFYGAHQQAQIQREMLKARQRQPSFAPIPQFIPQQAPPRSNLPIILGVLVLVMVGGIFMYMQSQKDEGYDYAPEPQQPYYEPAPPRRVRRRRRRRRKPKK